MNVILYEDFGWTGLLPLVYTRPTCLLLCGMETLWETRPSASCGVGRWQRGHASRSAEVAREPLGGTDSGTKLGAASE